MNVADIRGLFPGLKDTIYLNTATMAVGCTPARAAYERAIDRWACAQAGFDCRYISTISRRSSIALPSCLDLFAETGGAPE